MSDLISRKEAIKAVKFYETFCDPYPRVIEALEDLPSIQPEVIRCKDCKNWVIGKTTKNYPNPYICDLHSFMHGFERSALPEDYCSWAELR